MKALSLFFFLIFAVETNAAFPANRRRVARKVSPTPFPSATAAPDLASFLAAHLEEVIAPLDREVAMPRAELSQLRKYFSRQLGRANLAERDKIQASITLCDGIEQAMNERERAVLDPATANWPLRREQWRAKIEEIKARIAQTRMVPLPLGR